MRLDHVPHNGQALSWAPACAETTIASALSAMLSTINPAGIRDDKRNLFAMVLIPSENSTSSLGMSSNLSQSPKLTPS
jgi:hypothetical protein